MTPLEIIAYYANLLIVQYLGQPKAAAQVAATVTPVIMPETSVQAVTFSEPPVSGSFVLNDSSQATAPIQWNDPASTIQTDLRALSGFESITVTGSISSGLEITFTGVVGVASLLTASNNSLLDSAGNAVQISIIEIDQTLPIQVQNAFNLMGSSIAIGVQLDLLGKYVGVVRTGSSMNGPISLDDSDFLTLIRFAIVQNNSGSSLQDIEQNLNQFFPGQFLITDFKNMYMSYMLLESIGSEDLFTLLIEEKLIPKPMGVGISVIIPPVLNQFFGFSTYDGLNPFVKPFNTYDNFDTNFIWLSYSDGSFIG